MDGTTLMAAWRALLFAFAATQFVPSAPADPQPPDNDVVALQSTLDQLRALLGSAVSATDEHVLREVSLHAVPISLTADQTTRSEIKASGRDIYVPLSFVADLYTAAQVEAVGGGSAAMLAYFRSVTDAVMYRNHPFVPIEEFFGLSGDRRTHMQSAETKQQINSYVIAAVMFVLAHELGHQARNAVYTPTDSDAVMRQKETVADEWGAEAMLSAGYSPLLGVRLATYVLDVHEQYVPAGYQGSHPPSPDRALHLLEKYGDQDLALAKKKAPGAAKDYVQSISAWKQELLEMRQRRADRTIEKLEGASAAGETLASETLAVDYMSGLGVTRDSKKGLLYFRRAAHEGDFWAQAALGYMYLSAANVSTDLAQARLWLGLADMAGSIWATANLSVGTTMTTNKPADAASWCQGKCVVDILTPPLRRCMSSLRSECVDACVNHNDGHFNKGQCERQLCNNVSDQERAFGRCFVEPDSGMWQSCATTCNVANSAPTSAQMRTDEFGNALRQVMESGSGDFASIRVDEKPRGPGETDRDYTVRLPLPDMNDCDVTVYGDSESGVSYTCYQYLGGDEGEANRAFGIVVERLNKELANLGELACDGSRRVPENGRKECVATPRSYRVNLRARLASVRHAGKTSFAVSLWVDTKP
jgi:TPR repeat protein